MQEPILVEDLVNGRKIMLNVLDSVLSAPASQKLIRAAMEDRLELDPLGFIKEFAYPMVPKETIMQLEAKQRRPIRIIMAEDDNGTSGT